MKKLLLINLFLLTSLIINCQSPYKYILYGEIDSNFNTLIFENYWRFDTIMTKKLIGYDVRPWAKGVIYDFNRNNTQMCHDSIHQEIASEWLIYLDEVLNLTFDQQEASTRWQVLRFSEDRIVFRQWYPKNPKTQTYPYYKYKKGKNIFIFKRVDSFGC